MVLLNYVVEVFTRKHLHPTPGRMLATKQPQCSMAGLMAIERHLQWPMSVVRRKRFAEERLSCDNATGTTQVEINGSALLIDSAIQVVPLGVTSRKGNLRTLSPKNRFA